MTCTCVFIVEDELSACFKTKTPSCIPKKKLKIYTWVWTSTTWVQALESTLPFKIASRNFWETAQLSKMLCDNAPFEHDTVSAKFYAVLSFLSLMETPSLFRE